MCENIDSNNIKSLSTFNLNYTNIDADGDIPLCLADDKEAASKAISLVIAGTRRGFVSLCADVASLLRTQKKLELKVERLKKKVIFCNGSADLQSSSSCHVSQLSLSDRESLSESLQLRIINHVLKERIDDVKLDKSSNSKMPNNKLHSLQFNKNKNPNSPISITNDKSSPSCSMEISGKGIIETENIISLNKNLPGEKCSKGIIETENIIYLNKNPSGEKMIPENVCEHKLNSFKKANLENTIMTSGPVDVDLRLIEENLKDVILENKIYLREMRSMKAFIIELQNELKKYKDVELLKIHKNSKKSDLRLEDIEKTEVIEMKTFQIVKKTEDSGLDSTSSENSSTPPHSSGSLCPFASAPALPNKPRTLHRSKAMPRIINKKF